MRIQYPYKILISLLHYKYKSKLHQHTAVEVQIKSILDQVNFSLLKESNRVFDYSCSHACQYQRTS